MLTGKTKSGFEYKVDEAVTDDWELYEHLGAGNAYEEGLGARKVLGEEQYKALKDHCRDENGRVPVKKFDEEFGEILMAVQSKNA